MQTGSCATAKLKKPPLSLYGTEPNGVNVAMGSGPLKASSEASARTQILKIIWQKDIK
jgi:hypothetical protein